MMFILHESYLAVSHNSLHIVDVQQGPSLSCSAVVLRTALRIACGNALGSEFVELGHADSKEQRGRDHFVRDY